MYPNVTNIGLHQVSRSSEIDSIQRVKAINDLRRSMQRLLRSLGSSDSLPALNMVPHMYQLWSTTGAHTSTVRGTARLDFRTSAFGSVLVAAWAMPLSWFGCVDLLSFFFDFALNVPGRCGACRWVCFVVPVLW